MQERPFWLSWAQKLQHWGVDQPAADLLEAAGPLTIFMAQVMYLGQPFLEGIFQKGHFQALVEIFEDQETRRSFAVFLRQEVTR